MLKNKNSLIGCDEQNSTKRLVTFKKVHIYIYIKKKASIEHCNELLLAEDI